MKEERFYNVTDTGIIGDMGVALARFRCGQMGHMFRDQPTLDRGIDAEIEIADNSNATGRLIKAQIKCGRSYFTRSSGDKISVPVDQKHYAHWKRQSLPVIFLLVDFEEEVCFWEAITEETVRNTGKHFVIDVPKENTFDKMARQKISELATPILSNRDFDVFDEQDVSTGGARRISYYLTLKPTVSGWTKPAVEQLIRQVSAGARSSTYFRDELSANLWLGQEPSVVFTYVYFDEKHRDVGEYVVRATWVDPSLDDRLKPSGFGKPVDASGFQYDWNQQFGQIVSVLQDHAVGKMEYKASAEALLKSVFKHSVHYWREVGIHLSNSPANAKSLSADFVEISKQISAMGVAPVSCYRLSKIVGIIDAELVLAIQIAARIVEEDSDHSRDYRQLSETCETIYHKGIVLRHELDELA